MNVSGMFSDDQIAVIACFCALAVCGLIAAVSFHFGPIARQQNQVNAQHKRALTRDTTLDQGQRNDRRAA